MRRRDFIQAIVGSSIGSPITAWVQQSGRTRLIGVLINGLENDPEMQASLIAFKQELERLNWSRSIFASHMAICIKCGA
jgi:hypothetical protein